MSDSWQGNDPAAQEAETASGHTGRTDAPAPTADPGAPGAVTQTDVTKTDVDQTDVDQTDVDQADATPAGAAPADVAQDAGTSSAVPAADDAAMGSAPTALAEHPLDPTTEPTQPVPGITAERDDDGRHHTELRSSRHVTAGVGAASDVGHRHEINQDAYRVELVPAEGRSMAVLVIADGVSSALNSDIASEQAVAAASRRLVGHLTETPQNTPEDLAEVMAESFALANMAVIGGPADTAPGSCTLIAGITTPESVSVANVGDSRGYWVGDDGSCVRMSIDDSVAQARIDMGVPREEAETGVHSHAITRWIGPMATDVTPRVLSYTPETSGWLLICSDGLWNYASDPSEIGTLVQHTTLDTTAELAAQRLVDWALAQGGRDNVTVALARWEHP